MEKLSKTWKCVIGVVGVLIVIGVWRGCYERALQNKSIAEMEQLSRESTASVKRMEDEDAAHRAAQDKRWKERAELDAAQQKLYALEKKFQQKVDAWNQGVESDLDVYSDIMAEIGSKVTTENDAVWRDKQEAEVRIEAELKELEKKWDAKLRATGDGDKWDAMYRAKYAAMRRAKEEARARFTEIEAKKDAEREAVKVRAKARAKNWCVANSRYTLIKFYEVFGEPNYWRPTEHGAYFYYKYEDGTVQVNLSDEYFRMADEYEVFHPIYITRVSADETASIPSSLRLASGDSLQPLKDKNSIAINRLVADWRARALTGESSKVSVTTFYNIFGEPKYWDADKNYYYLYNGCKKRATIVLHNKLETKILDGIAEFKVRRRDFDKNGTVYIEGMRVYEPSKLAHSIKNVELKAKGRRSGQFTGTERKTGD